MSSKVAAKRKKDALIELASKVLSEPEENGIFGKYIEKKFSEIQNAQQKIYAEKLINDVIYEARLGNLNRTTRIKDEATATVYMQPPYIQQQNTFGAYNYSAEQQ